MLAIRRKQVLAYLQRIGQPYREDTSNYDVKYRRNRIRRELLPRLEADYNEKVVDALLRLGRLAGEAQQVIADHVEQWMERCVSVDGDGCVQVDCSTAAAERPLLVREVFMRIWRERGWPQQAMGMEQWLLLCDLARETAPSTPRRVTLPGQVDACRTDRMLRLTPPRR
jgi:tRNA(Ile)-lysidine synthase